MPNPKKENNVNFLSRVARVKKFVPFLQGIGAIFTAITGSIYIKSEYDARKTAKKIKDINPYEYNKYDEDVKGFIRERADKAVDRKEPFDYVDELNRAQEYKNEHDRVPDPILRNPKKKYEDYKPINKKNDF